MITTPSQIDFIPVLSVIPQPIFPAFVVPTPFLPYIPCNFVTPPPVETFLGYSPSADLSTIQPNYFPPGLNTNDIDTIPNQPSIVEQSFGLCTNDLPPIMSNETLSRLESKRSLSLPIKLVSGIWDQHNKSEIWGEASIFKGEKIQQEEWKKLLAEIFQQEYRENSEQMIKVIQRLLRTPNQETRFPKFCKNKRVNLDSEEIVDYQLVSDFIEFLGDDYRLNQKLLPCFNNEERQSREQVCVNILNVETEDKVKLASEIDKMDKAVINQGTKLVEGNLLVLDKNENKSFTVNTSKSLDEISVDHQEGSISEKQNEKQEIEAGKRNFTQIEQNHQSKIPNESVEENKRKEIKETLSRKDHRDGVQIIYKVKETKRLDGQGKTRVQERRNFQEDQSKKGPRNDKVYFQEVKRDVVHNNYYAENSRSFENESHTHVENGKNIAKKKNIKEQVESGHKGTNAGKHINYKPVSVQHPNRHNNEKIYLKKESPKLDQIDGLNIINEEKRAEHVESKSITRVYEKSTAKKECGDYMVGETHNENYEIKKSKNSGQKDKKVIEETSPKLKKGEKQANGLKEQSLTITRDVSVKTETDISTEYEELKSKGDQKSSKNKRRKNKRRESQSQQHLSQDNFVSSLELISNMDNEYYLDILSSLLAEGPLALEKLKDSIFAQNSNLNMFELGFTEEELQEIEEVNLELEKAMKRRYKDSSSESEENVNDREEKFDSQLESDEQDLAGLMALPVFLGGGLDELILQNSKIAEASVLSTALGATSYLEEIMRTRAHFLEELEAGVFGTLRKTSESEKDSSEREY